MWRFDVPLKGTIIIKLNQPEFRARLKSPLKLLSKFEGVVKKSFFDGSSSTLLIDNDQVNEVVYPSCVSINAGDLICFYIFNGELTSFLENEFGASSLISFLNDNKIDYSVRETTRPGIGSPTDLGYQSPPKIKEYSVYSERELQSSERPVMIKKISPSGSILQTYLNKGLIDKLELGELIRALL